MMPQGRNAPVSCSMVPESPRIFPSASTAIATFQCWSRSCVAERKCSRRSSCQVTGRPSFIAAAGNDRLLGVERRLGAEAAADERRDHADRFEIALEQVGERAAAEMRRLRRRPHRQHVGAGIVAREHGAAFERHGAAAMERKLLLEYVRRARECGVDVAVAHGNDGGDVAREVAVRARQRRAWRRRGSRSPPAATSNSTATAAAASSAR